jgi:hypothetical protein
MEGKDVRMLEPGGDPDLAKKSFGAERGGKVRTQDFDRDLSVVPKVFGDVNRGHAAGAEFTFDTVVTLERGIQPIQRICHDTKLRHILAVRTLTLGSFHALHRSAGHRR